MLRRARVGLAAAALLAAGVVPIASATPAVAHTASPKVLTARTPAPGEDGKVKVLRFGAVLDGWRIGLDPGHNGGNADVPEVVSRPVADGRGDRKSCNSTGTATADGYPEHAFNYDVAARLATRLEHLGAEVELTRTSDHGVGPCVDVRGRFAEDADVDVMLSVHANGSPDPAATGFFAIISSPALSPSQGEPSAELAQTMIDALAGAGFEPSSTVPDALSERDDLATLNFARRPAVMLELGEMRNPGEAAVMRSPEGRQAYADALVQGVLAWAEGNHPLVHSQ